MMTYFAFVVVEVVLLYCDRSCVTEDVGKGPGGNTRNTEQRLQKASMCRDSGCKNLSQY